MQVSHVVGLVLLIASVPLQMYLMKHNENFKQLVAEIVQMLPKQMQGVTIDLTDYVKTTSKYVVRRSGETAVTRRSLYVGHQSSLISIRVEWHIVSHHAQGAKGDFEVN